MHVRLRCVRVCHNWYNGTQGSRYLAACNEAHNQLKQQLTKETGLTEELRGQLQDRQHQLDGAHLTIAAHQQTHQAEQRHTGELQAQLQAAKAEVQGERHVSAELQEQVGYARSEVQAEQQRSTQLQALLQQAGPQLVQGLLHLVIASLDEVIIPGVVTCLAQTWLHKAFTLSHACMAFALSHACMTFALSHACTAFALSHAFMACKAYSKLGYCLPD